MSSQICSDEEAKSNKEKSEKERLAELEMLEKSGKLTRCQKREIRQLRKKKSANCVSFTGAEKSSTDNKLPEPKPAPAKKVEEPKALSATKKHKGERRCVRFNPSVR